MSYNKQALQESMERCCKVKYGVSLKYANTVELFNCLGMSVLEHIVDEWEQTQEKYNEVRNAYYISAEFLMGRALRNNLINLGIYEEVKDSLEQMGIDLNEIEEAEQDAALGNGGLGRLAACFMDSGATIQIPLQGYGIRYSNGLFKQIFVNGVQKEIADEWLNSGAPFSVRREQDSVQIKYSDYAVRAVPYDTPIIGYGVKNINTLRLWQSEPLVVFDFELFNAQRYNDAVERKSRSEDISRVLYPNDTSEEGKILRLRQQYFLVSASLQDIVRKHKAIHGDITKIPMWHTAQLNDTHPTLAIPEFIRILVDEEGIPFEEAYKITKKVFAYTNHTILQEALEKWEVRLIHKIIPRILEIIQRIDHLFRIELYQRGYDEKAMDRLKIIQNDRVHMAHMAIHMGYAVNGVAKLHTEILKNTELKDWYNLYPEKFQNKTNGITPRRWLKGCNPRLANYITELLGSEEWVRDLSKLKALEQYMEDDVVLEKIMQIKHENKLELAEYIKKKEGVEIDPNSIFDIQVKRLHEYKRQILNALYIVDLHYRLKENPNLDIPNITFLFGAKAFPGYYRAKTIIKFINTISEMINNDNQINKKIKVVFVENYNVTYAEQLIPAADVSKQISTAGKEASGTGNMKFMLNGAPTFGTYDGANVEIVDVTGEDNNFIFGLRVEDIEVMNNTYNAEYYYDTEPDLRRALDLLINNAFRDKEGFDDLWHALVKGVDWQRPDPYYVLADFKAFKEEQEKVFSAYKDKRKWAQMCLKAIANSGIFSSDRTIGQYANEIWQIEKVNI